MASVPARYKSINAMQKWPQCKAMVSKTEEAIEWSENTSTKRLHLPEKMLDDVNDNSAECARQSKIILLRGNRQVAFGGLPYFALLTLRGNWWMNDTSMGHGLGLLAREHPDVGIINPNFCNMHSRDDGFKVITSRDPFCAANQVVLLALHVDGSHWFIGIDFGSGTRGITVFDPFQASNSKYYDECEDKINEYFAEFRITMALKRETSSRQPDTASCGPVVLAFFERYILGILMFRNQV